MSNAIERLRASRAEYKARLMHAGHLAGKAWSKNTAEYGELIALYNIDIDSFKDDPIDVDWSIAEALGLTNEVRSKAAPEILFNTRHWPEPEWLVGWIDGAQQYFDEVKDEL